MKMGFDVRKVSGKHRSSRIEATTNGFKNGRFWRTKPDLSLLQAKMGTSHDFSKKLGLGIQLMWFQHISRNNNMIQYDFTNGKCSGISGSTPFQTFPNIKFLRSGKQNTHRWFADAVWSLLVIPLSTTGRWQGSERESPSDLVQPCEITTFDT